MRIRTSPITSITTVTSYSVPIILIFFMMTGCNRRGQAKTSVLEPPISWAWLTSSTMSLFGSCKRWERHMSHFSNYVGSPSVPRPTSFVYQWYILLSLKCGSRAIVFKLLLLELHCGTKLRQFLNKSSKTIDFFVFFEPKWSSNWNSFEASNYSSHTCLDSQWRKTLRSSRRGGKNYPSMGGDVFLSTDGTYFQYYK
mgnify:CR=1 FL=1